MNTSLTDEDRSNDPFLEPMEWEAYFPPPVESSYAREKMDGEPLKRVMQFPIDGRLKGGGANLAQLRIPQHPPMVMASSTKEVESMLSLAVFNGGLPPPTHQVAWERKKRILQEKKRAAHLEDRKKEELLEILKRKARRGVVRIEQAGDALRRTRQEQSRRHTQVRHAREKARLEYLQQRTEVLPLSEVLPLLESPWCDRSSPQESSKNHTSRRMPWRRLDVRRIPEGTKSHIDGPTLMDVLESGHFAQITNAAMTAPKKEIRTNGGSIDQVPMVSPLKICSALIEVEDKYKQQDLE